MPYIGVMTRYTIEEEEWAIVSAHKAKLSERANISWSSLFNKGNLLKLIAPHRVK